MEAAPGSPRREQRPEGTRRASPREKQNAGPCQTCLAMPEIGNTEPSYSGTSWERICPVHHCPIPASPKLGGDHLPSSSHTLGPVSTQSNGQVPSSSQDSQQHHLYYPCNQQDPRGSYGLPPLPGHGERPMLCSHLSSGDPAPASHHETSETPWKQWSPGQRRPVQHHIVTVRHDKAFRMPKSYSQMIAEWPIAVLVLCSVTAVVCTVAGLLVGNLPDFSEPLMGFEPRDTDIGRKLVVWRNVESHTGYRKTFSLSPYAEKKSYDDIGISRGQKAAQEEQEARTRRMVEQIYRADGFFCGPPEKSYSQLVFMSTTAGSLWNLQAIQSMCQIEQDKIRSHVHFRDLCQRTEANECCPSWSLGNYIAVLYNRSSCLEITQGDISHTLALLRACAPDYHKEMQMAFPSKKQCVSKTADLEFNKDPNFNFSSNIPADGVFKATNQGLPKSAKKVEPLSKKTATRGPLNRYKLESELKTKNQLLETAKQQLYSRLTGAQGIIKELKEENEGLVQEVEKLKKFQETCMVILESRSIDPVTGSNILEEEEKTQECQKQTMLLTEKLIEELRLFNQTAAKEKEVLQTAMAKWKSAAEERHRSLEKHSSFQAEIKECSATLDELELLLAM
uniref:Uncharacterized protein n=1 Tax=Accipiter nisus TaxID=211598 RepID=A0A8B9NIM2_9AVES